MRTSSWAVALACGLWATTAFAQATRTWISGAGDDANACSRTAPCRTVSGALSKTAAGGEIDALDPAAPGTFTITKSITIDGMSGGARVLASGGLNGITVNAAAAVVILRNLKLVSTSHSGIGIRFLAGAALHLENVEVSGFAQGIVFEPSSDAQLYLRKVAIRNNAGEGIAIDSASGTAAAVLAQTTVHENAVGVSVGPGAKVTIQGGAIAGNADAGVSVWAGDAGVVDLNVEGTSLTGNGIGVAASSTGGSATARLSKALIAQSAVAPTALEGEGAAYSFGNNRIVGGSQPGCAPGTLTLAPSSLAPATANKPFPDQPFTVFGAMGTPGLAETGALPEGMQFAHGTLSGTPARIGTYPITVSAKDGNGCTASQDLTLEVVCPAVSLEPSTLAAATTGTDYGPVAFTEDGGTPELTWALDGGLPIGVTFDGGVLAGMPTEPGSFPFTLSVSDSAGCPATRDFTLDVAASATFQATALSLTSSLPTSTFGEAVTFTATVGSTGGDPTGSVTFWDGSEALGTVAVSQGQASLTVATLGAGSHALSAVYSGDVTFGGSRAQAITQQVAKAASSTSLTAQAQSGGALLVAQVTSVGGAPDGTVTFTADGSTLGSAALGLSGVATLTAALGPGAHVLGATYGGSANFAGSNADPVSFDQVTEDGGTGGDGGTGTDGGMGSGGDAGTGAESDGGTLTDGGTGAGADDGGTGAEGGSDAPTTPVHTGCGCTQAGGASPLALVLVGLWGFGRRKRRSRTSGSF